jgi:hypothetical protein
VIAAGQSISAPPEVLLSSYEDLRRTAVGPADEASCGVGLGMFIRSGMASWLQTCATFMRPGKPPPLRLEQAQPTLAPDLRNEVAMVLAEMALSVETQGEMT